MSESANICVYTYVSVRNTLYVYMYVRVCV